MSKGKNTIYVGPAGESNSKPLNVEGLAVAATTPGMVAKSTNAGIEIANDASTVFGIQFMVADKDQQRTKLVTEAWTINENMVALQPRSGEFFNVLVITGQNLNIGTALTRNGSAGALKIANTAGLDDILCYSDEDVTTTGTQLVRVRAK